MIVSLVLLIIVKIKSEYRYFTLRRNFIFYFLKLKFHTFALLIFTFLNTFIIDQYNIVLTFVSKNFLKSKSHYKIQESVIKNFVINLEKLPLDISIKF